MRYILLTIVMLGSVQYASAATLYMDPNTATLNRGDAIKIAIRVDTDEAAGECINTVDAVIAYSENIVPVDISVGRSILPLWVEKPTINRDTNTITFAGGIPNGYCGRVQGDPNLTNTLVEIFFRAPGLQVGGGESRNVATVTFTDETNVLLNDGQGTRAPLQTLGTTFTLNDGIGSEILDPWSGDVQLDDIPPEEFSATVEMIDNNWFVVFNTTDKQTGISHYEVIEETYSQSKLFNFGAATAPWIETRSPHLLKDQTRNSVIRVRAIDKAGNEYVTTIPIDESVRGYAITTELIIVVTTSVIGLLTLLSIGYWLLRRRQKKAAARLASDESIST